MNKEVDMSEQKRLHGEHAYEAALAMAQVVHKMCLVLAIAAPVAAILALVQMFRSHSDWIGVVLATMRNNSWRMGDSLLAYDILAPWLQLLVFVPGYMLYQSHLMTLMTRLMSFVNGEDKYSVGRLRRRHRLGIGLFAGVLFPTTESTLLMQESSVIVGTVLAFVILIVISLPIVILYVADVCVEDSCIDDTRTVRMLVVIEMIILASLGFFGFWVSRWLSLCTAAEILWVSKWILLILHIIT